jgi:hypothetical protein
MLPGDRAYWQSSVTLGAARTVVKA